MRLQKALKEKKKLAGEISRLKRLIAEKNSYVMPKDAISSSVLKYDVPALNTELMSKLSELVGLKYAINEANLEIQSKIYLLAEYKGLVEFWKTLEVKEGEQPMTIRYGETILRTYKSQIDEKERDAKVREFQEKIDALQEEIDTYNFTTEIPWNKPVKTEDGTTQVKE